MYVVRAEDVPSEVVTDEGAEGATIRWVISEAQRAPTFALRIIEVEPGGQTPFHTHGYEHEVFVLEGTGELVGAEDRWPLEAATAVLVAPDEQHNFRNTGDTPLRFICCIPLVS
jgi:quercetin dioxygenase-like cupin family protein